MGLFDTGYETAAQMIARQNRASSDATNALIKSNMANARTGQEQFNAGVGGGLGMLLGGFLKKKFGSESPEVTAAREADAQRTAYRDEVQGVLSDTGAGGGVKSNTISDEGGFRTETSPTTQLLPHELDRRMGDKLGALAAQQSGSDVGRGLALQAKSLQERAVTGQAAYVKAEGRKGYAASIKEKHPDLADMTLNSDTPILDTQKLIEEREEIGDDFTLLTKKQKIAKGINPNWLAQRNSLDGQYHVKTEDGTTIINEAELPKPDTDKFSEILATKEAEWYTEHREKSYNSVKNLSNLTESRAFLDEGIITGLGAGLKLNALRGLKLLGTSTPEQNALIARTEGFALSGAKRTLAIMASGDLGSGTGLSDNDKTFAERVVAANGSLDEKTIRDVLDMTEKYEKMYLTRYNRRVGEIRDKYGDKALPFVFYEGQERSNSSGVVQKYIGNKWTTQEGGA